MLLLLSRYPLWGGLLVLVACQTTPADPVARVAPPTPAAVASTTDAVPPPATPHLLLAGVWVNAAYYDRLRHTHSPRQAVGSWGRSGITELLIDRASWQGDSLRVELGARNHEGLPLRYVHLASGPVGSSWATTAQEVGGAAELLDTRLRYQVSSTDTLLYLEQRPTKTRRLTSTAFRKVPGLSATGASLADPLASVVHRLTFTGTHLATDSTGRTFPVRFTNQGRVEGLLGHQTYQVNTDFEGPFHELDTIFLDLHQLTQREFAFAIHGDTIYLYTVQDDTTTYKRQRGGVRYTLIRQTK